MEIKRTNSIVGLFAGLDFQKSYFLQDLTEEVLLWVPLSKEDQTGVQEQAA